MESIFDTKWTPRRGTTLDQIFGIVGIPMEGGLFIAGSAEIKTEKEKKGQRNDVESCDFLA